MSKVIVCCPECGSVDKLVYLDFRDSTYNIYAYCKACDWFGLDKDLITELKYKQKQRKYKLEKLKK